MWRQIMNKRGEIPKEDMERIFLNQSLAKRMPFLFNGLNPCGNNVEFAPLVMFEFKKIENKESDLPSTQRRVISDYVEAFRAFKDNPKKD